MTEELDKKLEEYAESDFYPFHMPGHKRTPLAMPDPYTVDITEIEGFDNLHAPEGILKAAQERAAELYGSKHSYYLVNGSTCGILAAVSAAAGKGKKFLMARNVHKAVYHAVYLRELSTIYLQPEMTGFGIQGGIRPKDVREQLEKNPDTAAVMITSPTYEGVVSDVAAIAGIVHEYGIPLIVDEAHGAHFGFHPAFPDTAVHLGADAVIQSMHKVLPSLTQTALLHLNSKYISKNAVERFLDIYETSSPSYVLMGGMEKCIRMLREDGESLFSSYAERLFEFYRRTDNLKWIHVMKKEDICDSDICDFDSSKLVISVKNTSMTGKELYDVLLEKYHLQMEMVSGYYVLGMTSIMDRKEGFDRLYQALKEIDSNLSEKKEGEHSEFVRQFYHPRQKEMEIFQAVELPVSCVSFEEAVGRISADYVYLYPPGIPVLLPGEKIDGDFIKNVRKSLKLRLNLQGIADIINERINVVNF